MKKQFLGLALLALANSAMAQDANTLRIKGQLDVFTDSVLVYHTSPKNVVDTIALKDGRQDKPDRQHGSLAYQVRLWRFRAMNFQDLTIQVRSSISNMV